MIAMTQSIALVGMEGHPVDVEVSLAPGLPVFTIVGLPDPSIQEARERVKSAVVASGEKWPENKRVTVNLSPAHLRKHGSSFDLAMAVGVLIAAERISAERVADVCMLGELSLDGTVRRVRGVLPSAFAARTSGARSMFVPRANAAEAALVRDLEVFPFLHLSEIIRHLRGETALGSWSGAPVDPSRMALDIDLSDVRGNEQPKRALEIAAAGGHNLLMIGTPGGGKTMLARRLPGILPPMTEQEAFEVTRVHSVAGLLPDGSGLVKERPFRAPHHSASTVGLVGGGSGIPFPGEASLAHRGVLFMDEFGEFRREALQSLRQPMEDGVVTIVRSKFAVTFPARFQLIAASNPCACGQYGDSIKPCECSPTRFSNYKERLSGPIMDRVDMQVNVPRLLRHELFAAPHGDTSEIIAARVAEARMVQAERGRASRATCNAELPPRGIEDAVRLELGARAIIEREVELRALSARAAHRILRVARTIADLAKKDTVDEDSIDEAFRFRVLDRVHTNA